MDFLHILEYNIKDRVYLKSKEAVASTLGQGTYTINAQIIKKASIIYMRYRRKKNE